MKIYKVNGQSYEIDPDQEEQFLKDVKSQGFEATLQSPEVDQPQDNQKDKKDNWLKSTIKKGADIATDAISPSLKAVKDIAKVHIGDDFHEYISKAKKGLEDGSVNSIPEFGVAMYDVLTKRIPNALTGGIEDQAGLGDKLELERLGKDVDDDVINRVIEDHNKLKSTPPSQSMSRFLETFQNAQKEYMEKDPEWYKENPKSAEAWAFVRAAKEEPSIATELLVRSIGGQLGALKDDKVRQEVELSALAGGTGALALGQAGPQALIPEELVTVPTTMIGAAMFKLNQQIELGNTFVELLDEKLQEKDKEFNFENVREILKDEDLVDDMRHKSWWRGTTIGGVDALGIGISGKVYKSIKGVGKTAEVARVAATTGTEAIVGSTGEVLGQKAAGQELDVLEVGFEGFAGAGGAPVSIGTAMLGKGPKYIVLDKDGNETKVSRADMKKFLETQSEVDIAKADIKIENDPELQKLAQDKFRTGVIQSQIDPRIDDEGDRQRAVELEKKKMDLADKIESEKLDTNKKIFEQELIEVENELAQIAGNYTAMYDKKKTAERADARKVVREKVFKKGLEFAKKHSALYGLKVNDKLTQKEIREQFGEDVAQSDGFIEGDQIIINTEVAAEVGAVNVGNHELLHGILRQAMKDGKITDDVITQLKEKIGEENWKKIEQRAMENYTPKYMENNPDEWITLTSDAIQLGDIKYDDNPQSFKDLMNTFIPIFRRKGYKKIKFDTGEDVFNFLKEYNESIHKGSLSSGIVQETGGKVSGIGRKMSRSNLGGLLSRYSNNLRPFINDTMSKKRSGEEVDYGTDMDKHGNSTAVIQSEFGQEVMPIVESITKRLFDPIPRNISDNAGVSRKSYQSDLVNLAATLVSNEYKFKQPIDKFVSNRLNLRAQSLAKRLGIPSVEESSQTTRINRQFGDEATELQVADETATEITEFEGQDILKEQTKKKSTKPKTTRDVLRKEGKFIDEILKFPKKTTKALSEVVNKAKYKTKDKSYKDVKNDIVSQATKANTRKQVKPTGPFYSALKNVSQDVFGVDPKSVIAKAQNLSVGESKNARQKISDLAKDMGAKNLIKEILPKAQTESGEATGLSKSILDNFYDKVPIRLPNKYAQRQKTGLSDEQILAPFGINPDFTLMPHNRKFDGLIKGLIVQATTAATNQSIREQAVKDKMKAENISAEEASATLDSDIKKIGVGKSDILFSKSSKRAQDIAKNLKLWAEQSPNQLMKAFGIPNPVEYIVEEYVGGKNKDKAKTRKVVAFDKEIGRLTRVHLNAFLNKHPKYRPYFRTSMSGGRGISFFGDNDTFNSNINTPEAEAKRDANRYKYGTDGKLLNPNKVKQDGKNISYKVGRKKEYTNSKQFEKDQQDNLNLLGELFTDIKDYVNDGNQEATFLFAQMVKDSGYNQNHIIRMLAPLLGLPVDNNGKLIYNEKIAEEHVLNQNNVGAMLLATAIDNGNINDVMDIVKASYMQFGLLESDDVKVNGAGYKSKMPDIFWDKIVPRIIDGKMKRTKGLGSLVRYTASGVNLNNYYLPGMKKTVTEHFGLGRVKNASEFIVDTQNKLIDKILTGEISKKDAAIEMAKAMKLDKITLLSRSEKKKINSLRKAKKKSRQYSKSGKAKGMSTFDFDETLIIDGDNFVIATDPETKQEIRISSAEWPTKGPELTAMGYEMNFDDFVNVRGGKEGPLLVKMKNQIKKYGANNVFILTARPQSSDIAIHEWLKSNDVNIPFKNITGLADSRGEAKAQWMLDKFAEGYNDMYFVDDALPNVDAVKEVLDQLDIKSKVVQAKTKVRVGGFLVDVTTQEGRDFIKDYNNVVTVRSSDPDLANRKIKFSKSANKTADRFNQQMKKWREGEGKTFYEEMNKIPTIRSSEFKRMGAWIIDTTTKEGKEFVRDYENIPTVSSSEFGPGHYEVNGKIYKGKYPNGKLVSNNGKIKFSKSKAVEFNEMLERVKGIAADKNFTVQEARKVGANKGKNIFKNFFVPPSAEDFKGLLYSFLGRGKMGDADLAFFKEALLEPFAKGIRNWNTHKQSVANEYANLKKQFPDVIKIINKKVKNSVFTNDDAIRVYLWDKAGFETPGISEEQKNTLIQAVEDNPELKMFAEGLSDVSRRPEGYIEPNENWVVGSIASDLNDIVNNTSRQEFIQDWIDNKNEIFSEQNLNKIEAIYGKGFRDALENMLYRMETGKNRMTGSSDRITNKFLNWINGSVGAVMFMNIRSAALQTISTVNFINWADNNIFKAAAAFANQPQFWKDFSYIFNSDMLKQRRAGLQIDVNANELANTFIDGRSKPEAIIRWLLEKGFTPTQVADSFAIAMGGATFYRNRLKTYLKRGLSETKAQEKAWLDFQEIAEETQQSSRPDLISMQQAGVLGRIILAWQNTPMQMTRLTKKALSDIVNGRGDMKSNISRVIYYGVAQNIIFGALQTGLMFMLFGMDDDEEKMKTKEQRVANGALDSLLRGTGVYGAAIATLKNTLLKWQEESKKGWKREDSNILIEAVNLSPPIGSKLRKLMKAVRTEKYNKGVSDKIGLRIENPNISIAANWVEALTNAPVARIIHKANNVEEALTGNHEMWQRAALIAGWDQWSVGVKDEELEAAKEDAKEQRKEDKKNQKEENKKTGKTVRCSGTKSDGSRCSLTTAYSQREQIAFKGSGKKTWLCPHHSSFKDGQDRDLDGKKEYQCTGKTSSGKRCKNKGEYTGKVKRCYAHK